MSWWSRTFPTVGRTWNWFERLFAYRGLQTDDFSRRFKVMFIAIPYHFVLGIGWQAFSELSAITDVERNGTRKVLRASLTPQQR